MNDFQPNIPIYAQLMSRIKHDIISGVMAPGSRLPSVRELAEQTSVNPNTVQRAYQELEREGISETRRGTGSFVCETDGLVDRLRAEMAENLLDTFACGMRSLGYSDEAMTKTLTAWIKGAKKA